MIGKNPCVASLSVTGSICGWQIFQPSVKECLLIFRRRNLKKMTLGYQMNVHRLGRNHGLKSDAGRESQPLGIQVATFSQCRVRFKVGEAKSV